MGVLIPQKNFSTVRAFHKIVAACQQHGDRDKLKSLSTRLAEYERTSTTLETTDNGVARVLELLDGLNRELYDILGE